MASPSTPLRSFRAEDQPLGLPTIPRLQNGEEDSDALRRMVQQGLNSRRLTDEEADAMWADLLDGE